MAFTTKEFPDQVFKNIEELHEARRNQREIEQILASRSKEQDALKKDNPTVIATIVPAPKEAIERQLANLGDKLSTLEGRVSELTDQLKEPRKTHNKKGLKIGLILQGESKGHSYALEVLEDGYLCGDGRIYPSLSAAAEGVSGNRRSGWAFWKDANGTPIGALTGRFKIRAQAG